MGDPANEKKRKNKSKYVDFKKFRSNPNNLDVNQKGFIVTCNFKEPQAVIEAYNILNSLAKFNKEPAGPSDNVDEDLRRELEALKTEKPFKQAYTNCKNVVFIRVKDEHDPAELINGIYARIDGDQSINCRFINKMMPIQITTTITKKNILDNLANILKADRDEKATYRIEIVTRMSFNKISKDELIKEIADLVGKEKPDWSVDLAKPKKLIYIDLLFKICGLSILDDYFERSKYNLNVYCKKVTDEKNGSLGDSNADAKPEESAEESCANEPAAEATADAAEDDNVNESDGDSGGDPDKKIAVERSDEAENESETKKDESSEKPKTEGD